MVENLLNFKLGRKLPIILQTEAAECGLACLAMIASYYGYSTDIVTLRQRFLISTQGTTLTNLIAISNKLNISARALKVDDSQLEKVQTPCLLHWDLNHFVTLKYIKRGKYVIHDPAFGERKYTQAEFNKHFTGVAVEFTPTSDFAPKKDSKTLSIGHFWNNIKGIKRSLINVVALALVLQLFSIVAPFYMQIVLDDVIINGDVNLLVVMAFGFGMLVVAESLVNIFRSVVILNLSTRLSLQMATNLYRHMIKLPVEYFQKRHLGDILSRVGSLESIKETITSGLVAAIVDGFMTIIMLAVMLYYSIKLTFVVLFVVFIFIVIRYIFYSPIRQLEEESLVVNAKLESHNIETIRSIIPVKLYQKENDRQTQWQNKLAESMNKGIRTAQWGMGFGFVNQLLFGIEGILVIYFGSIEVLGGDLSVGMLIAYMAYKTRFSSSINSLIGQWINFKMMSVHLDRLADIAYTPIEDIYKNSDASIYESQTKEITGRLEVKNLEFSFGENVPSVFENVNFVIEPGETVVITGPSGCGKTTLLKCLMGLLKPTKGEILVDGVSISEHLTYRSNICAVMQSDQLLSGSLRENITFFDLSPNEENIISAAKMASIHEEIQHFPMQYETLVGDMGSSLSGGQHQRIVLARALYSNPKILFLDEATSHLDVENEKAINKNIQDMDITRIMVAHRAETISTANREIRLFDE